MSQQQTEMETIHLASRLLKAVWTQIDLEFKAKYRMDIWQQVESNVKACAMMSSTLNKFVSSLCSKFQVATPGRNEEERAFVDALLCGEEANPDDVLKVLRQYPQVCVLELRVLNDAEKEERMILADGNR